MTIEKRLERVEAILDARGLDWDHPRVASDHFVGAGKMVADEPAKKWRILEPGEVVCSSDWANAKTNPPSDPPNGCGWIPADVSVGTSVFENDPCVFARPVADEPAKEPEPEHLAGPMPDPGEGYRILSKDPLEDLTPGDEFEDWNGKWIRSSNAETTKKQGANCWYRRKIEVAKELVPSWEPRVGDWVRVTRPDDWIEWEHPCWAPQMHQFDGKVGKIESEREGRFHICGFAWHGLRFVFHRDWLSPAEPPSSEPVDHFAGPRISPGEWLDIRDAYRDATPADVGKLVYVRNGELEPWIELRLAEVTGADFPYRCTKDGLHPMMWRAFRYACIRNERPANKPEPAWEPKVGDWVRVRRPDDWDGCRDPDWLPIMHEYHDKVMQVSSYENILGAWCAKFDGVGWFFHRDWLTPSIQYFAEPPEIAEVLETEYRRPSLPEDAGKLCEFSDDGESWVKGYLRGFDCDKHWNEGIGWLCGRNFLADRPGHRFARIKKDA